MKSAQFATEEIAFTSGINKDPVFLESKQLAREINLLIEGKQLGTDAIHNLFTGIEQQMTAGNQNKTLLGKGAAAVGAVGAKIAGLGQWLKNTTPVQGVDDAWADLKNAAAAKLEKSPGGSTVLRNIDRYRQLAKKYPQTSAFFWNAAAVVGGLMSGGLAVPAILGAMKGIDALVQGKEFSSAVGQGLGQFGKTSAVMGAKNLAISAANATDIPNAPVRPDYHDPVYDAPTDTNVTPPVTPDLPTSVVAAKGDTLSQIAQANQTSVKALMQANPHITNPNALLPGTQINLPPLNSTTYMGGVGTASDTAAGVASGKFTDIPTALANQRAAMMRENVLAAIGFTATRLPMNEMVDKYSTVRTWALNESLGHKGNRSLQLTEDGVNVVLYNIEKIHEHVLREAATDRPESQTPEAEAKRQARAQARAGNPVATDGRAPGTVMTTNMDRTSDDLQRAQTGGTVYSRPADGNNAAAQAKAGNPANTSSTAGPLGGLPGGNVGGLATGTAPAGNTMPYLAADPEGKFDTKYKGGVGNKFVDKVEGGLKRAGNWLSGKWKSATTKFEANRAKRRLTDAGISNDSDAIAQWLVNNEKVPQDIVTALYQQLGFPAPAGMQAAGGAEAGAEAGTAAVSGATNTDAATGGAGAAASSTTSAGGASTATDSMAGVETTPARSGSKKEYKAQRQAERLAQRNAQGGGPTPQQEKAAVKDFQADADSLIRDLLNMSNVTQPAYVKYIRDRLNQHFPDTAAAPATATTAPKTKAKAKSAKPVSIKAAPNPGGPTPAEQEKLQQRIAAADAASRLGPQGAAAADAPVRANPAPEIVRRARSGMSEGRRSRQVRESAVDKMQKDFEHFVNNIG